MALHIFLFLLVVCLLLTLALLWRLGWLHLQPSHSAVASRRSPVHRLLKPRSPLDCPACRLASTASSDVEPASAPVRPWREVKSRRGAPKRVNPAFLEPVNLSIRHARAALARRTWARASPAPHLLAHLEWWRAS
jgi:hypothetical protein